MKKNDLTIGRVIVEHPSGRERAADPEAKTRVHLQAFTPGGTLREIPLDENDLVRLTADAARVLAILRGVRV